MFVKRDNVRDNRAAGDVEIVGADKTAKLSAETSLDHAPAASCSSHCYPPVPGLTNLSAIIERKGSRNQTLKLHQRMRVGQEVLRDE